MIRHVAFFKFLPGISEEKRSLAVAKLKSMKMLVPGMVEWSIGEQINSAAKNIYDVAEVATFQDLKALDDFKAHPEHGKLVDIMKEVSDWQVIDYEYEPEQTPQ